MTIYSNPLVDVEHLRSSTYLDNYLSAISTAAIATLRTGGAPQVLSFVSGADEAHAMSILSTDRPGNTERLIEVPPVATDRHDIETLCAQHDVDGPNSVQVWKTDRHDNWADRVVLSPVPGITQSEVSDHLMRVWPDLRLACANQNGANPRPFDGDLCEGWDLLDHVALATLLVDASGRLVRTNRAGQKMLDRQTVLRRAKGSIYCAHDNESSVFHAALRSCAKAADDQESTVLLTLSESCHQAPVAVSRYFHRGRPTPYVLVTLPVPPSPRRIEALARKLGLNRSEARVAALLQMGHSNREAAEISGLKPQTFNTYAKRVFGKLNVRCRTEMAQMLTWQASGRGPS